jgi:hypothetical protein
MAVSMALVGCDSKAETPRGAGSEGGTTAEAGKAAEGSKVAKHAWGGFRKGSFVKFKKITEMEVAGNKTRNETTITETLKDLTPDDAIIEEESLMANQPATKTEWKSPLRAAAGARVGDAPKPKAGSEEIEIGGKKLKCDWTETETELNGDKTVTRVYTSGEIPGFTARMTVKSPTMSLTQEVVEFSAK